MTNSLNATKQEISYSFLLRIQRLPPHVWWRKCTQHTPTQYVRTMQARVYCSQNYWFRYKNSTQGEKVSQEISFLWITLTKNLLMLALLFAIPFFSYEWFSEQICRWERRPQTPKIKLRAVDRLNRRSGLSGGLGIYLSEPRPAPLPFGFENLFYLGFVFFILWK